MAGLSPSPSLASNSPTRDPAPEDRPEPVAKKARTAGDRAKARASVMAKGTEPKNKETGRRTKAAVRSTTKTSKRSDASATTLPARPVSSLTTVAQVHPHPCNSACVSWAPHEIDGSGAYAAEESRARRDPQPAPCLSTASAESGSSQASTTQPQLSQAVCALISQSISRGIEVALDNRGLGAARSTTAPRPRAPSYRETRPSYYDEDSISRSPSPNSELFSLEADDPDEMNFSEDETPTQSGPPTSGLFKVENFRLLLHKAKQAVNMAAKGQPEGSADPPDPAQLLFTEPVTEQEVVPAPKMFLDIVKRQWSQPGAIPAPSNLDKKLYSVESNMEDLLSIPTVDPPMANLTSTSFAPADAVEGLKNEDRKSELSCRKTHTSAAWAIKAATAASFFNRASLVWLRQLQARLPPEDERLQQDINKVIAATEYSAEATMNSAKFASRALASNVLTRRMVWLRHWQTDTRSKAHLSASAFQGNSLFGEALEPLLVEGRDKRKFLPSQPHRQPRRSFRDSRRPSFRQHDYGSFSQSFHRGYQQMDRFADRSSFRDRGRSSTYSGRPFRGQRSRPFRRSK